jgi:hypothetical protein
MILNSLIGAQLVTSIQHNLIDSLEDLVNNERLIPLVYNSSAYLAGIEVFLKVFYNSNQIFIKAKEKKDFKMKKIDKLRIYSILFYFN